MSTQDARNAIARLVMDKIGGDIEFDRIGNIRVGDLKAGYDIAVDKVAHALERALKLELSKDERAALPRMSIIEACEIPAGRARAAKEKAENDAAAARKAEAEKKGKAA